MDADIEIVDIKKKQKLLLQVLKEFHGICEEYSFIYNIFGGTLLGAVRHHGIIPWDDDVDVTMPRDDYNKFIYYMNTDGPQSLEIYNYPREDYIYPYAKLGLVGTKLIESAVKPPFNELKLNIDIFPNDGYPDDESIFEQYKYCEKQIMLQAYSLHTHRNPFKRMKRILDVEQSKKHTIDYYLKCQIDMFTKKSIDSSEYIICQGAGWGRKGKLKKDIYFDRVLYDFNNIKVWGIRDYDEHLTNLYGDYMTPPPKDKQIAPHGNTVLVTKEIYDKYLLN